MSQAALLISSESAKRNNIHDVRTVSLGHQHNVHRKSINVKNRGNIGYSEILYTPVYENLIELTGQLNFEVSLELRKSIINITN